jgi:hypothetical protein
MRPPIKQGDGSPKFACTDESRINSLTFVVRIITNNSSNKITKDLYLCFTVIIHQKESITITTILSHMRKSEITKNRNVRDQFNPKTVHN